MVKQDWREGAISPRAIAALQDRIGEPLPVQPWVSEVTSDAIWHFALGLGDDNPLWQERRSASRSHPDAVIAPPAYLYTCQTGPTTGQQVSTMGLPFVFGMWGSDEWEWRLPVYSGDRLTVSQRLADVRERDGSAAGHAIEQIKEYTIRNEDGAVVAVYRKAIIQFERRAARDQGKYLAIEPYRYSDEEIQAIRDQYRSETARRRGSSPRYWEDVTVDEAIGPIVKGPLTITGLVGWVLGVGAPLCMTNRLLYEHLEKQPSDQLVNYVTNIPDSLAAGHYDSYFGRHSGLPTAYDFGPMRPAWCSHLLTDWMGDLGTLRRLRVVLRRPNLLGDTTWVRGRVTAIRLEEGHGLVDCELICTNQRDVVNALGTAVVELPRRPA